MFAPLFAWLEPCRGVSLASLTLPPLCVFNSKADSDNEKKTNGTQADRKRRKVTER